MWKTNVSPMVAAPINPLHMYFSVTKKLKFYWKEIYNQTLEIFTLALQAHPASRGSSWWTLVMLRPWPPVRPAVVMEAARVWLGWPLTPACLSLPALPSDPGGTQLAPVSVMLAGCSQSMRFLECLSTYLR